jgi:sugar phosphate isomerase/epimerase
LEKYNHLLSALHISDNDGAADRHWLPFDGDIDFAEKVLPHLKGKDIPFTMELFSDLKKYPDEQEFLCLAHQRITKLAEDMEKLGETSDTNTEAEKNDLFFPFSE